ncbi:HPr family phosphocarrier protein [Anaerocolumna chitinilytica]|uniref:PTS galactitol transporter subunit IIC n=1 Tax=Anaerocolumna chitinilytica TaxID=1727145 RepID=A0A7M3S9L5_9FIRM|nr:HPr family phosphocarrier protein [Anaerocolumna chitinilytica]BCK01283.1 PTS galactitol transporter subunit IIC [Anaerocolumna chitinilytica]
MKEFNHIIADPEGIHARPAGELVKLLKEYKSVVTINMNGKSADARRIFAVMGLGVKQGQEILITAEGEDEAEAVVALESFFQNKL